MFIYTDNWVVTARDSDGRITHETNRHQYQILSGIIREETLHVKDHYYVYIEAVCGRMFRRSINYYSQSPYGWNEVSTWGGE